MLGVPGVTVLEEKLLLVLGWLRMLRGRCGEGRKAAEEDVVAEVVPEPEPVAKGLLVGVLCASLPTEAVEECARWAGYGDEVELCGVEVDEAACACAAAAATADLVSGGVSMAVLGVPGGGPGCARG